MNYEKICNLADKNMKNMNTQTIDILKKCFATQPITKARPFCSYARVEQKADCDVDIMVAHDENAKVLLCTVGGLY